jgi:hypothetical protein
MFSGHLLIEKTPCISSHRSLRFQELVRLAVGLAASGSRIEDVFWENRLAGKIRAQLRTGDDQNLEAALDQLYDYDPVAYGEFIYAIEAAIECATVTHGDRSDDVLMFAIPILTWSRFSIPSGPMSENVIADLRMKVQQFVLMADTQFVLADCLFSPDQLPRGYHLTHELAGKLWAAALAGEPLLHMNPRHLAETGRFLSDTRYVLGAVTVPKANPCSAGRRRAGTAGGWHFACDRNRGGTDLDPWHSEAAGHRPLFGVRAFGPDSGFSAWRMADHRRPYAMHATVIFCIQA